MSLYFISHILASVYFVCLSLFVFLKNKKSPVNFSFLLFGMSLFIWLFFSSFANNTSSETVAAFWYKFSYTGIILIPYTFANFIFSLIGKKSKILAIFSWSTLVIFISSLWLSNLLVDGLLKYPWGYYPKASFILHPFFLVCFHFLFILSLIFVFLEIWGKHSKISDTQKTRLKYVFFGSIFGTFGSFDFFANYGFNVYPFGFIFMIIFPTIYSYAIVRHQLMDIEVVIKRSLVFAGMFAFIFSIVVAVTMVITQFLGGANNLLALAVSALIIVFTLRPIETRLVNATDKFLFQKKHEYKEIIKAFIDNVVTELNLDAVINSTLKLLDEALHPYASSVFILNKTEDKYQLYNSLGLENTNIAFTSESKLVNFLKKTHTPAVIRQINGISGVNPEIASEIASLKAVIVLPLMLHNDLVGFIALGRKKSDDDYSKDDLDVLLDLARTESIAVANAQLLTEAAQAERRAAIGTMAAGINHEIGNPLNIMSARIQLFKLSRQKGMFKDKSADEVLDEAEAALDECLEQSGRISEITKKLANFAKPSKEFKPMLVGILEEIDETLGIVGHDLELEKIKINKNIPQSLPRILADKREIQQIFFNLIRNAGQAIEDSGTITIKSLLTVNGKVRVEIHDTGKGIPEDKKHRIFEPFFTTKGAGKGTGLGLSIVRQLVWRNKGEISFLSEAGKGTTFILEFPKGE